MSNLAEQLGLGCRRRGESYLWEEFADTVLSGFVSAAHIADPDNWPRAKHLVLGDMPLLMRLFVAPFMRRRVIASLVARDVWSEGRHACWLRFQKTLSALEARAPDDGFWLGPSICDADLALYEQLASLRTAITPWQAEQIGKRQRLSAYLTRVQIETCGSAIAPCYALRELMAA